MSIKALGGLQLPSQKEWGAGVGGLLAFAIIAGCNHFGYPLGDETDSLLVVVLPALVAKIVPPSAQDVLTHVNDAIVEAGVIAGKLTPPEQIVAADPSNTLVLQPAKLVSPTQVNPGSWAPGPVPGYDPPTPPLTRMVDPAVRIAQDLGPSLVQPDLKPHYIPPAGDPSAS